MILTTLMIASLLNVSDPSGDAVGAGELAVPKAAIFRDLENFDVLNFGIADQNTFAFEVSMASLDNPWDLPLGFSLPIIEVYASIGSVQGTDARSDLLPGSTMSLGKGKKWNYAFRITGNEITAYTIEDGLLKQIDQAIELSYTITDNRILIETNIRLTGDLGVYAMSGSYDPFSETGWRGVARDSSAWMLSSETQAPPVMDVVVDDFSMQQRSIQSGVLPEITASARQSFWLWIVVAGLLTCLLALIFRPRKKVQDKVVLDKKVVVNKLVKNQESNSTSEFEQAGHSREIENSVLNQESQTVGFQEKSDHGSDVSARANESTTTDDMKKTRPIQWTSWDEGEFASEDTLDTMIEFDRIVNEDVQQEDIEQHEARASQTSLQNTQENIHESIEGSDSQIEGDTPLDIPSTKTEKIESEQIDIEQAKSKQFEENLLPNLDNESLLSNKQPPKGFTKRMKTFGLDQVDDEKQNTVSDTEDEQQKDEQQ